jgi:hypothetical protein
MVPVMASQQGQGQRQHIVTGGGGGNIAISKTMNLMHLTPWYLVI